MPDATPSRKRRLARRTCPSAAMPSPPVAGASPADLRRAMGRFATGVTVVTSVPMSDEPVGTTANAVSSVDLDAAVTAGERHPRLTRQP